MQVSKSVFVPVADALNNGGKGVWLGWNRIGWVFLDRTLSFNQPSDSEYLYVRASDWTTYWEDVASSWKGEGAYDYYAKYLSYIQGDSRVAGIATVEALCAEYRVRASTLRHQMQEIINSQRSKKEEHLALARAEREVEKRIASEQARAAVVEANRVRKDKRIASEQARAAVVEANRVRRIESLKSMMVEAQHRDSEMIQEFIRKRGVKYLYHFTQTTNLSGIATHGVLPRSEILDSFRWNDHVRIDKFPQANCLSAGYINYKMLWNCRQENRDIPNWAVVAISPEILLKTPCLFLPTNAANSRFRYPEDESLASHMGFTGLGDMYRDEPAGVRAERHLLESWTTDPQAEILAFGRIPTSSIEAVFLLREDQQIEQTLRSLQPRWRVETNPGLFAPRSDYKYWKASQAVGLSNDKSLNDEPPFYYG